MNVVNKIEDTATTKAVVDFLKDLSCCDRCVLRFLGCKTYSRLYEASSSEIAEVCRPVCLRRANFFRVTLIRKLL